MKATVAPGQLAGHVHVAPSKSYTHRAHVLAALSGDGSVNRPLQSADTRATVDGLRALGFRPTVHGDRVEWHGEQRHGAVKIDVKNSGTTMRLLMSVAALGSDPVILTGDASIRRRPVGALAGTLRQLGVHIGTRRGTPPVVVEGPLSGGTCTLDSSESSQYLSSLLLALPCAPEDHVLEVTVPPRSGPYVHVTERLLELYMLQYSRSGWTYTIPGGQQPMRRSIDVPGDWSSAAFFLCAAATSGTEIVVEGLDFDDLQGDRAIIEILKGFGCTVDVRPNAVSVIGGPLTALDVDLGSTPDLFPALCAVAAVADGTSILAGAPSLRAKESDRISAMRFNLQALGIRCTERPDGLEIEGGRLGHADLRSFADHRVAQAALLLAQAGDGPSTVDDVGVLGVSFPGLLDGVRSIGGQVVT